MLLLRSQMYNQNGEQACLILNIMVCRSKPLSKFLLIQAPFRQRFIKQIDTSPSRLTDPSGSTFNIADDLLTAIDRYEGVLNNISDLQQVHLALLTLCPPDQLYPRTQCVPVNPWKNRRPFFKNSKRSTFYLQAPCVRSTALHTVVQLTVPCFRCTFPRFTHRTS